MKKALLHCATFLFPIATLLHGPNAQSVPLSVECYGWTFDHDTSAFDRVLLKQASFDPEYYEGKVGNFAFGADLSYLPQQGVGLIVYNNQTDLFASGTVGFRRIGTTKNMEADLKLASKNEKAGTLSATITCGYREP